MFRTTPGPFRLEADVPTLHWSSNYHKQSPVDDKWHPIAYYSEDLSVVERNYEIHDKEMLAIIRALEDWRHFLEGAHPSLKSGRTTEPGVLHDGKEAQPPSGSVVPPFQVSILPCTTDLDALWASPISVSQGGPWYRGGDNSNVTLLRQVLCGARSPRPL